MLSSGIPEGPRFVYRAQPITSWLSLPFNQQKSAERLLYTKLPLGIKILEKQKIFIQWATS